MMEEKESYETRQGQDDPNAEPPISRIIIEFAHPASSNFAPKFEGVVTPEQLILAGEFLRDEGIWFWRQLRYEAISAAQKEAEKQRQQIQVPPLNFVFPPRGGEIS